MCIHEAVLIWARIRASDETPSCEDGVHGLSGVVYAPIWIVQHSVPPSTVHEADSSFGPGCCYSNMHFRTMSVPKQLGLKRKSG